MREQIRDWNPNGQIKIKYTGGDGIKDYWECDQQELLGKIVNITTEYQEMGIKLTGRQLYYQLVAMDFIPNALEIYKRISKFATDSRYAGSIDWDAIEDRGRVSHKHAEWNNIKELIKTALYSYRLPRWDGQEYYVEILCEKQALESVLKPIADKWHVRFGYNKGYTSASSMYDLSKRVKDMMYGGKQAVILYFGDHDPSGLDMIRDIETRMIEFLTKGDAPLDELHVGDMFTVHPLALTKEQVISANPPPNPAKFSDPRAKEYVKDHGEVSWELDAIDPRSLQSIAETGVLLYLDQDMYNSKVEQEVEDATALVDFGNTL